MKNKKKSYNNLLTCYIKPHKKNFLFLYIISILENIISLLPTYFLGNIINYVIVKKFENIIQTIFVLCFIFGITLILKAVRTYLANWLNNEISANIMSDIYCKATNISVAEFQDISSGHIISLIEIDSMKIADFFVYKVIEILVSVITLLVSICFLFKLSFTMTIIAIMAFPLGFIGNIFCGKKITLASEKLRKINDQSYNFLNDTFNAIKEVKAYIAEKMMIEKFESYINLIKKGNMNITILDIISSIFNEIVSSIADWLIIGYGTWKIIAGTFSIGAYVAFNGYSGYLFAAIRDLLNINMTFRMVEVSLNRINTFLHITDENKREKRNIKNIKKLYGDISFNNVNFSYKKYSEKILKDFSVTFKSNNISVIVGLNGSGKSTIFSLLEQFYQPQSGNIYIGDSDLKDIDLKCLRHKIGMVQQHPIILSGTLRENLLYGNENVDEKILNQICEEVGLRDFITSFPDGYDVQLKEISGGQKQKIAIARVLIKNPDILLLDEVTSDLDGKSENEIIELLKKLAQKKTIILISHRINAIVQIPNIYVMDHGRIIGHGNHAELLRNCSLYSTLVKGKV